MIAALFVELRGVYSGRDDVDVWDVTRDARTYAGPHPVGAHPPCTRWCRLAGLVEARWGHRRGDDGRCFAAALAAVRRWGGVLEHPAWSAAWAAHGLGHPRPRGGWTAADFVGGWTCHVEQWRYGHVAKKATWLYAHGVALPSLRWGSTPDQASTHLVSWCGNRTRVDDARPRVSKRQASATPPEFAELLLAMARSARGPS